MSARTARHRSRRVPLLRLPARRWGRARRSGTTPLIGLGLACLAAVTVEAGALTGWFGLSSTATSVAAVGNTAPWGPDPNPFHETVRAVYATISYPGASSGYFSIRPAGNLCPACPAPPQLDQSQNPPVAGFHFFFNVTNTATEYLSFGNFTLTVVGTASASPFSLRGVLCCFPNYEELTPGASLTPGQSLGFLVYVTAARIPSNGGQGYSLELRATAP